MKRAAGYTLMEVLTAVVLLSIILPVAMHGLSVATSLSSAARHKTEAALLAHSKLSELQATRDWQNGVLSGDWREDHPEYRWSAELVPWQTTALTQLDVHVFWTANGREQHVTVSTLVDPQAN